MKCILKLTLRDVRKIRRQFRSECLSGQRKNLRLTIRRGWNNFFKNFAKFFAKVLDKCNSIEYNEIELAMQVGGIPNFLVVFFGGTVGNNKSATNKIYG